MSRRRTSIFFYFILLALAIPNAFSYWTLLWRSPDWPETNSILYYAEFLNATLAHVALIAVLSVFLKLIRSEKENDELSRLGVDAFKGVSPLLSVVAVNTVNIVYHWKTFFIDGDEYYQGQGALWHPPLFAAIQQHQQPLGYSIAAAVESIFGLTDFTLRIPYAVAGLLLGPTFYFVLRKLSVNKPISSIVAVFFCLSYHVTRFTHEARPQALALLTGLIFFSFCLDQLTLSDSGANEPEDDAASFLTQLAATYFFAISIGLQPICFILLFITLTLFIYQRTNLLCVRLIFPTACALAPALLNTFLVIRFGPRRLTTELSVKASQFFLHELTFRQCIDVFLAPLPWTLIALSLVLYVALSRRNRAHLFAHRFNLIFWQWCLFGILFFLSFKPLVDYFFYIRYCILLIVPLWMMIALSAQLIFETTNFKPKLTPFLILLSALISARIVEPRGESDRDIVERQNSRVMYETLKSSLTPADWVVDICVHHYSYDDELESVLALDGFDLHSHPKTIFQPMLSLVDYVLSLSEGKRPRRLIFLFQTTNEKLEKIRAAFAKKKYLKEFAVEYGYRAYEYQFSQSPILQDDFVRFLKEEIFKDQEYSRFQGPLLEWSNAILEQDYDAIEKSKAATNQLFPPTPRELNRYYKQLLMQRKL